MDNKLNVCRKELVDVHGVPIFSCIAEEWSQVESFEARPDDLLISTYPKSGTTWISEIFDLIYNNGDVEKCKRDAIFNRVPFMELTLCGFRSGVELLNNMQSPRLIKTHLPVQLLPSSFWKNDCKIIYMARNAKDVAVSYYYFYQMAKLHPEPGSWEEFLDKFMAGKVCFGSWYDHVKGWWEKRKDYRIFYLLYEDMKEANSIFECKGLNINPIFFFASFETNFNLTSNVWLPGITKDKNPKCEIQKLLKFLEKDIPEEIVDKILYHCSFDVMKQNPSANYTTMENNLMDHSVSPFMRKGITGDWKNQFTVAQYERFEEDYVKKMKGSTLQFQSEI